MKRKVGYITLAIFILMVLLSLLTPRMHAPIKHDNNQESQLIVRFVNVALTVLKEDIGAYPNSQDGLAALYMPSVNMDNWDGPYLRKPIRSTDYWGREWVYRYPHHCNINVGLAGFYSVGENGIDECMSGDDVFIEMPSN